MLETSHGWPFLGPTKTQIIHPPEMQAAEPHPYSAGGIDSPPRYVYVVQAGDTLADVARKLYGANSRENRRKLAHHALFEGAIIAATS